MRRPRLTITLREDLLKEVDRLIDNEKIRNRSHAIESILSNYFKTKIDKAVILAGGQGIKLRPLTYEIPKSLLPVKSRPVLEYLVDKIKKADMKEIILCLGYLGEKIKEHFGDGLRFGVRINYLVEKEPLGTGGALFHLKKMIKEENFLMVYGDILTKLDLKDLINFHFEQKTVATVALTLVKDPKFYGQIKLHGNRVVSIRSSLKKDEEKSNLVNAGLYVFNREIFNYLPKNKKKFSLDDVLAKLIDEKKLAGFVFEDQWFDLGTPQNYEEAIKKFEF